MEQRVDFADVPEKLIAEAFALARPFNQTGNVANFKRAVRRLLLLEKIGQDSESRIRHQGDAGVGIDGRKGIIGCQRAAARERVEDGGLPHVRKSDHAATESHALIQC